MQHPARPGGQRDRRAKDGCSPRKFTLEGGGRRHPQDPGQADLTTHTGANSGRPSNVYHSCPEPWSGGPWPGVPTLGLPWPIVGPELVGERPKEAAATCDLRSGGGGTGDARQQFQALQYVHPEVPETPQTSPTISSPSSLGTGNSRRH